MVSPSAAKLVEGWCEMATAKPKVKRMMLGGAAKAAVGAVKKAVASKAAPMQPKGALGDLMRSSKPTLGATAGSKLGPSGGSGFNRTPAQQQAISKALGAGTPPRPTQSMQQAAARSAAAPAPAAKQMQFMSNQLRGLPMNPPRPGTAGPRPMQAARFGPDSGYVQQLKQMSPNARQAEMASAALKNAAARQASMQGRAASKTGLGNAVRGLGAASAGVGKALGMGKKKGGAVKKATKK